MQKRKTDEKGFTLIEVIVTLVLVAITAALAGMWIVSVANGYVFAKMNASTVQKAQLAMTRLEKEFVAISSVQSAGPNTITYTRTDSVLGPVSVTVSSLSGNALQLKVGTGGDSKLTDIVRTSDFSLLYCNDITCSSGQAGTDWPTTGARRIIEITLTLTGANNTPVTFIRRVAPRNL